MIGEFIPGRLRFIPARMVLVLGVDIAGNKILVADTEGNLETFEIGEVSIDWHYDAATGEWKPDFGVDGA